MSSLMELEDLAAEYLSHPRWRDREEDAEEALESRTLLPA